MAARCAVRGFFSARSAALGAAFGASAIGAACLAQGSTRGFFSARSAALGAAFGASAIGAACLAQGSTTAVCAAPASQPRTFRKTMDLRHVPPPMRESALALIGRGGAATERTAKIDANKCALVLVDLQHFFLKADDAPGQALVPAVNAATAAARAAGVPVFWVNWGVREDRLGYPGGARPGPRGTFPPAAGEADAEVWHELTVDRSADIFVNKHRLTGFFESELDAILRQAGIRTLFFGGVNTGQCVWGTVIDAKYLGYDSVLVPDMCATTEPQCATEFVEYNNGSLLSSSAAIVAAFEPLAGTDGVPPAEWAKL